MKKIYIVLILIFYLLPVNIIFAETRNVGFIPANIWYSKDPFEEGDRIKIYTLVFNPDLRELSGTVSFFDKSILLGKKEFQVKGSGIQDISIDWTVNVGEHIIFAKIENAKFLITEGKYENVILIKNETEESKRSVSKKITLEKIKEDSINSLVSANDNLKNLILEKTPNIISEPIIATVNTVENLRQNTALSFSNQKEQIKEDIKILNQTPIPTEKEVEKSHLEKPFKYVKLFFLNILFFIFNNKLIFYSIVFFTLFFCVRYGLRKIF